jgi:hypothetical protein
MNDKICSTLKEWVSRTITVYNKYHSPEATAKIAGTEKDGFIIEFEGPFSQSCCINEYFEDFIYDLEDVSRSLRAEIKAIEPTGLQSFRVHYIVRSNFLGSSIEEKELFREFLGIKGLSFEDYLKSNTCTRDVIKFHFRTWLLARNQEPKK